MAEYKDISDLKKQISDFKKAVHSSNGDYLTGYVCALSATEGIIAGLPDADVVKVVRCRECTLSKDCRMRFLMEACYRIKDPFCAAGERREGE